MLLNDTHITTTFHSLTVETVPCTFRQNTQNHIQSLLFYSLMNVYIFKKKFYYLHDSVVFLWTKHFYVQEHINGGLRELQSLEISVKYFKPCLEISIFRRI